MADLAGSILEIGSVQIHVHLVPGVYLPAVQGGGGKGNRGEKGATCGSYMPSGAWPTWAALVGLDWGEEDTMDICC